MSKIYTKTGDEGHTSLVGGTRLDKDHIKIDAYGTVDELNAWIGILADKSIDNERIFLMREIQDRLFTIGADLATEPDYTRKALPSLYESDIELLEKNMDIMTAIIPPLRAFVLPGGHEMVSFAHVARTVCRRAERMVVKLSKEEEVKPIVIKYLNRLSDFLFVLSRMIAFELKVEEVAWKPRT